MFLYKNLFFQYLLFYQSQSCLLESTATIFWQYAGYFYSCEAASWAELYCGALGLFLQFKEFELFWGAVFLRLEEKSIGEVFFFKSIFLEWVLKQEIKHVKKIAVILLLNKMMSGAKRVVFC